jgi:signal transduction histidine kinase
MHKYDSALIRLLKSYDLAQQANYKRYLGSLFFNLAGVYLAKGDKQQAVTIYKKSIVASKNANYLRGIVASNIELAKLYLQDGKKDSSFYFANESIKIAKHSNTPALMLRSYTALAAFYRSINRNDSTVKYQDLIIKMNDSLFNSRKIQQFQNIDFDEQQRQFEIEAARKEFQSSIRLNILLGSTFTLVIIAFLLFRSTRIKQKAKQNIERAFEMLKSTQAQLIQSEKMASLGELTAGIAHEIQNPLNFVNNFSDVSNELIREIQDIRRKTEENNKYTEEDELLNDIAGNLEKISHHGMRAADIVKGMLQHSRTSSGQKELTDINVLCDEYLRLSYHGLRAKDKSFNAKFETDFDATLSKINVVPQDIGRVILNLINNAFYAVSERLKAEGEKLEPTVSVSTKKEGNKVLISVKDNGNGIPENVKEKIFQPFFTTKPTGQGTGLGLSLSYDIVKAHGGELKVETKEGRGSEFIIMLPV